MSRVQLALNVSNLDEAIGFYSKLFATEPAKVRDGYANFAVVDPPLKLVLIEGTGVPGSLNHLGVEVASTEDVTAASNRLSGEGLDTAVEDEVSCCFAVQDKVWVDGPDGEPWEIYTVLADAEMPAGQLRRSNRAATPCAAARHLSRLPAAAEVADASLGTELELGVPGTSLGRRLTAEFVGTAFLVAIVVGSGIAARRLSADTGLQLLENAVATGAGLIALILTFGHVSGARFNPLVSAVAALDGDLRPAHAGLEAAVQIVGGITGAVVANLMFDLPAVTWSTHDRISSATCGSPRSSPPSGSSP